MADRKRSDPVAFEVDRGDGKIFSARVACTSRRAARTRGVACAAGPARPSSLCVTLQSTELTLRSDLFAGDLKARPLSKFGAAQLGFLARDIVARHLHDALALGELNLDVHQVLLAERHLR